MVEQQQLVIMPQNDDSRTIGYDQRFLFGQPDRYPPLAYKISKVSPSLYSDIITFTMTQEQFSSSLDNAEEMIGGYYASVISPELPELEETPTVSDLEIVYAGSPSVKAGGGFKKFSLKSRVDGKLVDVTEDIEWGIDFPSGDPTKLECSIVDNVCKIKCVADYTLIGKTFTITAQTEHSSKSLIAEIASL